MKRGHYILITLEMDIADTTFETGGRWGGGAEKWLVENGGEGEEVGRKERAGGIFSIAGIGTGGRYKREGCVEKVRGGGFCG